MKIDKGIHLTVIQNNLKNSKSNKVKFDNDKIDTLIKNLTESEKVTNSDLDGFYLLWLKYIDPTFNPETKVSNITFSDDFQTVLSSFIKEQIQSVDNLKAPNTTEMKTFTDYLSKVGAINNTVEMAWKTKGINKVPIQKQNPKVISSEKNSKESEKPSEQLDKEQMKRSIETKLKTHDYNFEDKVIESFRTKVLDTAKDSDIESFYSIFVSKTTMELSN